MTRALKAAPGTLPSITELGLMLGLLARREAAIDLMPPIGQGEPADHEERWARASEERRRKTADCLLFSRIDALRTW